MKKSFRIISLLVGMIFVLVFAACSNQFDELKKSLKAATVTEVNDNTEENEDTQEDSPVENSGEFVTYKIEHCLQNIYDDDYVIESVQIRNGFTGEMTQAIPKTYKGFDTKTITQNIISADGSTVARICYDRKIITYTFDADSEYGKFTDNSTSKRITKRYGTKVELPSTKVISTRPLFSFAQWPDNIPETYDIVNQTFFAKYEYNYCDKITYLPAGTDGSAGTEATYVYFGVFPQTLREEDVTVTEDDSKRLANNELPFYLGSDYEYYTMHSRNRYWYKLEPIKWRVVTTNYNNTSKALLVAENILIASPVFFYQKNSSQYWKDSDIRNYLNNSFLNIAFSNNAKTKITNTTTALGSTTSTEQVFLLSRAEIEDPEYGFSTEKSINRIPTDYAKETNADNHYYYGCNYNMRIYDWWWLRDNLTPWGCITDNGIKLQARDYFFIGLVPAITVTLPPQ